MSTFYSEFVSRTLENALKSRGIMHEYATRATPQQNGIAERSHRTDVDAAAAAMAAAMCAERGLPKSLWGYAYLSAVYTGNFVVRSGTGSKTPFELFTGRKPDIRHLRVWGCEAFVHKLPADRSSKFDLKATRQSFIGYGELDGFKAWYVYHPTAPGRKVTLSRDVVFRESTIVAKMRASPFIESQPATGSFAPAPGGPAQFGIVPSQDSVAFPPAAPAPPAAAVQRPLEPPADLEEPTAPSPDESAVEGGPADQQPPPDDARQQRELAPSPTPGQMQQPEPSEPPEDRPLPSLSPSSTPAPPPVELRQSRRLAGRAPQLVPQRETGKFRLPPKTARLGHANAAQAVVTPFQASTSSAALVPVSTDPTEWQDCAPSFPFGTDAADFDAQYAPRSPTGSASSSTTSSDDSQSAASSSLANLVASFSPTAPAGRKATSTTATQALPFSRAHAANAAFVPHESADCAAPFPSSSDAADFFAQLALLDGERYAVARAAQSFDVAPAPSVVNDGQGLSRRQAHADPVHGDFWRAAEAAEFESLESKHTWDIVDSVPADKHAIRSHFVYKIKRLPDGSIAKYKARIVVDGNRQMPGDHGETFAATARLESIRIGLAIAARDDLDITQMDVDNAFVQAPLQEEVYVRLPDNRLARLRQALYGLKQAPRAWYQTAKAAFGSLGFERISADECVFVNHNWHGAHISIILYVDDMLILSPIGARLDDLKAALMARFAMKDLGPCTYFLGLEIKRDRAARKLWLHQTAYARSILAAFGMLEADRCLTPFSPHTRVEPVPEDQRESSAAQEALTRWFGSLVGNLAWLVRGSRPDLAQATSELARVVNYPTQQHRAFAPHVLRYLAGTVSMGLVFGTPVDDEPSVLYGSADADDAGCRKTRKSRGAYAFRLAHSTVSWHSKLQPTNSLSSVESELKAATEATREAMWLRKLLTELGYAPKGPTLILNDNEGARAIAENPEAHQRMKHVDRQHFYMREQVQDGKVVVRHIPTAQMPVDALTKAVPAPIFERCVRQLGLAACGGSGR